MENFDIEAFISEIEERHVIWDKSSDLFKDRNKTKATYEDICNIFLDNYQDLTETEKVGRGKSLMHKWNTIRDSYVKCHKKIKTLKSGAGYKKIRKYIFYEQLQFLAKTVEHNATTSSLAQDGNGEMVEEHNVDDNSDEGGTEIDQNLSIINEFSPTSLTTTQAASQPSPARKQAPAKKGRRDDFETKLLNILEQPDSPPKFNEDKSFFDSILPTVEKLDTDDKLQFRVEVLQLLQRFKQKQIYATSTHTFASNISCLPSFAAAQSRGSNYSQDLSPKYHTLQYPQNTTPHSFTSSDSATSYHCNAEYE